MHVNFESSVQFFIHLCVCMFLQEMVVVTTKELVHVKVEGLTKGLSPLDNLLCAQQSTFVLTLPTSFVLEYV